MHFEVEISYLTPCLTEIWFAIVSLPTNDAFKFGPLLILCPDESHFITLYTPTPPIINSKNLWNKRIGETEECSPKMQSSVSVSERVKYFKICYRQAYYCNQSAVGAGGLGIRKPNDKWLEIYLNACKMYEKQKKQKKTKKNKTKTKKKH